MRPFPIVVAENSLLAALKRLSVHTWVLTETCWVGMELIMWDGKTDPPICHCHMAAPEFQDERAVQDSHV